MPVRHRRRSPQALKLEVLFQSQSPLLALSRWPVLLSLATRKASNTYCQHLISNTSFRRLARYGYHLPPKPLLRSTPCTEHVEFYITRHPWLHLYPTYHQLLVSDSPSTARSPRTSTLTRLSSTTNTNISEVILINCLRNEEVTGFGYADIIEALSSVSPTGHAPPKHARCANLSWRQFVLPLMTKPRISFAVLRWTLIRRKPRRFSASFQMNNSPSSSACP